MDLRYATIFQYRMNDNAADKVVKDYHGLRDGVSFIDTNLISIAGKIKNGFSFGGSSNYIDTQERFTSVFQADFSVSFWMKPSDGRPASDQCIFNTQYIPIATKLSGVSCYLLTSGKLQFSYTLSHLDDIGPPPVYTTTTYTVTSNYVFVDGTVPDWVMVTLVVDSDNNLLFIYINGVADNTAMFIGEPADYVDGMSAGTNLIIGRDESSVFYEGGLDIFALYNTVLQSWDVWDLWRDGDGTERLNDGLMFADLAVLMSKSKADLSGGYMLGMIGDLSDYEVCEVATTAYAAIILSWSPIILAVTVDKVVQLNAWHHFCVVYDNLQPLKADKLKFYIDGIRRELQFVPVDPDFGTVIDTDADLNLGYGYQNGSGNVEYTFFKGKIDNFRLYDVALEFETVKGLYNKGQGTIELEDDAIENRVVHQHIREDVVVSEEVDPAAISGVVSQLKMNDDAADKIIVDAFDYEEPRSVNNTEDMAVTLGKFGGALRFNGTSDYINCRSPQTQVFNRSFSLNTWLRPIDIVAHRYLMGSSGVYRYPMNEIMWYMSDGVLIFKYSSNFVPLGGSLMMVSADPIWAAGDTDWIMVTVVMDNETRLASMYLNGELLEMNAAYIDTSFPAGLAMEDMAPYANVAIGAYYDADLGPGGFYSGDMDNFITFNKVLSLEEIVALYGATSEDFNY